MPQTIWKKVGSTVVDDYRDSFAGGPAHGYGAAALRAGSVVLLASSTY